MLPLSIDLPQESISMSAASGVHVFFKELMHKNTAVRSTSFVAYISEVSEVPGKQ